MAAKKIPGIKSGDEFTFAQALNLVLTGKFRALEQSFIDSLGQSYTARIYSCKDYVRADFCRVKEE